MMQGLKGSPRASAITSLKKLFLSGCGTRTAGFEAIGAALASNSSLTELVLKDSRLGHHGVKAIAFGLAKTRTPLREVAMVDCGILACV